MKFTAGIIVLLMLLTIEYGPRTGVEARECRTPSKQFKGICVSAGNCASVCQTEGFPSGDCGGFRRKCYCTKPCA